jgi:TonB family protein
MQRFVVMFCLISLAGVLHAQQANVTDSVSESDARQHLIEKIDPVYPPIAAAARVEGDVVISVVIDVKGHVVSEKVLSGPAMLQQSGLDAVKKWQFNPFDVNSTPASVTTELTVPFHLEHHGPQPTSEQEKAAQAWFPISDKCRNALKSMNTLDSLNLCKQALDLSLQAGDLTNSDQLGRLLSYQYYGHALLSAGRAQEALEQENLAIAEAKKCVNDKDEEYAEPFFWRAIVEAHIGDANGALSDFQTAEQTMRRAIINLPDMKEHYTSYLSAVLKQHAALLDLMGRQEEAAKLRSEAGSL